jgi:hypothetical protein
MIGMSPESLRSNDDSEINAPVLTLATGDSDRQIQQSAMTMISPKPAKVPR